MEYLKIHGWDDRQSLRKNVNGTGTYFKVWKTVLTNAKIAGLTDQQFGVLVKLWAVASQEVDTWGKIPNCPKILKKVAGLDKEPDLQLFVDAGLMSPVNIMSTSCLHGDDTVLLLKQGKANTMQGKANTKGVSESTKEDAKKILEYLNQITGRRLENDSDIVACLKREGATVEDCKAVIDYKWAEWGDDPKMARRVDATTPFRPRHFQTYLDQARSGDVIVEDEYTKAARRFKEGANG